MAISLKHTFQSAKADGPDNTIVQPSDWNDEHVLTQATGKLLGRTSAGTGATEEISAGTGLSLAAGSLSVSSVTASQISDSTTAGRALLTAADAPAQRTSLGLGTAATMTGPSGTIVGTSDTQTLTNKTLTGPIIDGQLGAGGANYGTSGQVLTSQGAGVSPAWATPASAFPSGTVMLFVQTNAPTGWTKSTTHNNKALRVVSGTASSGGSVAFTTAFASQSVSGTVGATTLSTSQIPSHGHNTGSFNPSVSGSFNGTFHINNGGNNISTQNTGGGGSHDHSFTGTAINLAVQYVDVIIATKD